MIEIPELAMKVVEILRRDIPKPKELPGIWLRLILPTKTQPTISKCSFRWNYELRGCDYWYCCPMGLHPKATVPGPFINHQFPVDNLTNEEIVAFADWWDEQTDAQAAVDAIWNEK